MDDEWFELNDKDHFWMKWRWSILNKHLKLWNHPGQNYLEIGCGNCVLIQQLEESFDISIDGCDLNKKVLEESHNIRGKLYLYNVLEKREDMLEKYSAIFLLDVIEHIESELEFLEASLHAVKKGGYCIVNVPACSWLYSDYDKTVGHWRRYDKKDLLQLFERAGLEIVGFRPWGFSLIPILMLRKLILRFVSQKNVVKVGFKKPNKLINLFFRVLMFIENLNPFPYPIGASTMVFLRKPG